MGEPSGDLPALVAGAESEPTRAELEARMEEARTSIGRTMDELKGTISEKVDAVADTVTGVLTMSEQFQREPVAWSLGALSAGFAMGYSLGRAHHAKAANGRPSKLARLADDVAAELATFGDGLVSPGLSDELKTTFGVDLTAVLARIAAQQTRPRPRTPRRPARSTSTKAARPKRTRRKGG